MIHPHVSKLKQNEKNIINNDISAGCLRLHGLF